MKKPKKKDNPKLLMKKLSDGRYSLYLEYYLGYKKIYDEVEGVWKIKHNRRKESLGLYLHDNPKNKKQVSENNKYLDIAYSIRQKKEDALKAKKLNVFDENKTKINFLDYCDNFLKEYPNKDIRIVKYCISYFKQFIKNENGTDFILPVDITYALLQKFKKYLDENLNGETPYNYFTKMKKICKYAIDDEYPLDKKVLTIRNQRKEGLKKDILFFDEIELLAKSPCGNNEVKQAFFISLFTGLRYVDVSTLKWTQIYKDYIIIKSQKKTGEFQSIDLNETTKQIFNSKEREGNLVFNLPSLSSCLRTLKIWSKRAGINKNITWHSARHSFAVNLLIADEKRNKKPTDIKTVAESLGHSGLKHVEKYTRVVNEIKKQAINNLPKFDLRE